MVSKEQFLEIKRCRVRGMKAAEIVNKVGISAPSVRKWWDIEEKTFDERIKGNIAYLDNYREFILNIDNLNSVALRWLDNEGNGTSNLRTRKPPRELFAKKQGTWSDILRCNWKQR